MARPTDASNPELLKMQKELLDTFEQASRGWLARVQSEVNLWSDLGTKLTSSHSVPDALEVYQKFVAQRMQMAAEDGRQLFEECQRVTQKITRSLSGNWPSGGSS